MTEGVQTITFKGSVATVTEFLGFAIYSILHQRGVYPQEDFKQVQRYNVPLMVSTDSDLNAYLTELLQQVAGWVAADKVRKLVMTVADGAYNTVVERWAFDIVAEPTGGTSATAKTEAELQREIQAVMRQITSSVSYLPMLPEGCVFDILVYTEMDVEFPSNAWEISEPRLIPGSSEVRLRTFATNYHRVNASVTYREDAE
ncbi:rev7 [Trypanosoma rangeli]|uniref:Rev7 n=1 Tax=Trypanosoma rangeli TaxID=5698 RepID=A0A3R7NLU2_TRYRA|nr:rev7 [Trypanosoma rangeli]RNF04570.1 rev7 [Trypanosoma rangeli]|eukprot:RNF04570.1 rev7 [Trypanosoma rangeli]